MLEPLREAIRTGDHGLVMLERVVGRERGECILRRGSVELDLSLGGINEKMGLRFELVEWWEIEIWDV